MYIHSLIQCHIIEFLRLPFQVKLKEFDAMLEAARVERMEKRKFERKARRKAETAALKKAEEEKRSEQTDLLYTVC